MRYNPAWENACDYCPALRPIPAVIEATWRAINHRTTLKLCAGHYEATVTRWGKPIAERRLTAG